MLLSLLLAATQAADAPQRDGASGSSIYESIELGFKLCAAHVVQQGHLSEEHSEMLSDLNVSLLYDVPENIRLSSGPLFNENRIFAAIETNEGNVYILAAQKSTACRVVVADTTDGLRNRVRFVDNLRQTSAWTYDLRRSRTGGGIMRDELTSANGRMIAIMNGPNVIANGGNGIQSILTVALLPPMSQSSN